MRSDDALEDGDGWLPARVVVAGIAALCAVALAVGAFDGAPPERQHGRAASGAVARPAVAGERGPAVPPPGLRLSLLGPGGELVEFPAARRRPWATAEAGPRRGTGTP